MSKVPILQSNKKKYGQLLENNETVFNPLEGKLSKVKGDSHADSSGGERVQLKEGDKIFSSAIKLPKEVVAEILGKKKTLVKKMSPAELSTKFPIDQYDEILKSNKSDERAKNSAMLNKAKNIETLNLIFEAQEGFKQERGVKDGILLKDQGLNNDLEPINSQLPEEIISQVGGNIQIEQPTDKTLFERLNLKNRVVIKPSQILNSLNLENKYQVAGTYKNKYTKEEEDLIKQQYTKLGLPLPQDLGYNGSELVEVTQPGWLNDHPFIKSGLVGVKAMWNNKLGRWHKGSDVAAINKIKKENPDWNDTKIRQVIGDYQAQTIGLKPDGSYEDSPEWRKRRAEVFKHNQENSPWKHQQYEEITLPDGSKDYRFKNYVDDGFINDVPFGDNERKQIIFPGSVLTGRSIPKNPLTGLPFEPTPLLPSSPLSGIPLPNRPAPDLTKIPKSITANPNNPLETIELQTPKELQKAKMSTYLDMFNRQKAVPYLRNDNQTVAYQRFIPMNTLAQERGQNFLNSTYNNSDATSQITQGINADNYAKTLEGIDNVQLKNYQADLQVDNQNNQMYMNAFNANELSKNNNMADYVGKTQIVEDQFDKEGELMKDNLRNYGLQEARMEDDLQMRKLSGLLTNEKFVPDKFGRNTYGISMNPYFERLKTDYSSNPFFQNDQQFNNMIEKMKNAGISPNNFDDVIKAYAAQSKK